MQKGMQESYDAAVIGGAFSGAATALLLRREAPELRVVVIERSARFDRKVGEATTEVSGCFLTKRLALTHHLCHHHVVKNGLRFWFSQGADDDFDRCGEVGAFYQVRLPSYQVDREVLDEHLLMLAQEAGADVLRPAKVTSIEICEAAPSRLTVRDADGRARAIFARWVIDASGRAAVLARRLELLRRLPEHPTNAIWARFRNVKDWDGYDLISRFPSYARSCQVSRSSATNHLTGYGWWCWIIPLRGGDYSAGLVYDSRLYSPPEGARLGDRLKGHLLLHPVGKEIFRDAEYIEGDVKAYSALPYYAERIAGPGWQIVGDAAAFLDPLYSQGLDYCSWTVSAAVDRIMRENRGGTCNLKDLNKRFLRSYWGWFEALYKDKYHYLGDQELMTAAFLMDLGLFFFGPVRSVVRCPRVGFVQFPFEGALDGMLVSRVMAFYNQRLARIAQKRKAAGVYGSTNLDSRTLLKGFEPNRHVWKLIFRGVRTWWRAELRSLFLPAPAPAGRPASVV
ncbi:MAG TPA: NAD(P)/FAD-dependent oxidoreductase [Terrimicrobiaceae bacterium]